MMKRVLTFFLAIFLVLTCISPFALADTPNVMTFPCGKDLVGTLDFQTHTLTISGTGRMDFYGEVRAPWFAYNSEISSVLIEEGVTTIEENAFLSIPITEIHLPASVERVGANAFYITNISKITVSENSRLCEFINSSYFQMTAWYKSQPDGPVYIGRLLFGYKGDMPENTTIEVRKGTFAINTKAFYQQSNLVGVTVPDSLERIGANAFFGTAWMDAFPKYTSICLGSVFYYYNHPWKAIGASDIQPSFTVPAGITALADGCFANVCTFKTVEIPADVTYIGEGAFQASRYLERVIFAEGNRLEQIEAGAFYGCWRLKEIALPDRLCSIGDQAFGDCRALKTLHLPATVTTLGTLFCENQSLTEFSVADGNTNYRLDEKGILYDYDQTVVYAYPLTKDLKSVTLPETVTHIADYALADTTVSTWNLPHSLQIIGPYAFHSAELSAITIPYGPSRIGCRAFALCKSLTSIVIPRSVKIINAYAFYGDMAMETITIPPETTYIDATAFNNRSLTFYCYSESVAYYFASENNYSYVLLSVPDTAMLETLLDDYATLNRSKYLPESLTTLDHAAQTVDLTATVISQETVDNWCAALEAGFDALEYTSADYSGADQVLARCKKIDRSLYTAESLAALDDAIRAIPQSLDISEQSRLDAAVQEVADALEALCYLPADYTAVNAAIAQANTVNRLYYSQSTLMMLDQKVTSVDFGLNILQQETVDTFASDILAAIERLDYAEVVLRDEPNGIVVSATTKEIIPGTALTVDALDPSRFEAANFAVGGHIKSVQYFDISLIRESARVQPNGTVTVKIRIPDGISPEKCRVYHVTNDPVDPLVRFANTLDGNYIVFHTDHFSEFAVIEVETVLSSIAITTMPAKTVYSLGELFDPTGMTVTATFSDGAEHAVTDFDVSVDTTLLGEQRLTVYYTFNGVTKAANSSVLVVSPAQGISLTLRKPSTTSIRFGDTLVLHATVNMPNGATVLWDCSENCVQLSYAANGLSCNVKAIGSGSATVTATVVDRSGMPLSGPDDMPVSASEVIAVNGGFFARVISFFKNLFRVNRVIDA